MNATRHPHATYVGAAGRQELLRLVDVAGLNAVQMFFLRNVHIDGLVPGETTNDNDDLDEEDNVGWKYEPVGVTETGPQSWVPGDKRKAESGSEEESSPEESEDEEESESSDDDSEKQAEDRRVP